MNHKNKIYYNSSLTLPDFESKPHSTFPFKTKSYLSTHTDLVKCSSLPVPIYTVKYNRPLVEYVSSAYQYQAQVMNKRTRNFLKLHRQYKDKIITEKSKYTTVYMKEYVESVAQEDPVELKLPRGSLKTLEQNNNHFLFQVNNENSIKALKLHKQKTVAFDKSNANKDRLADELMLNKKFVAVRRGKIMTAATVDKIKDDKLIEMTQTFTNDAVQIASTLFDDQLIAIDRENCVRKWDLRFQALNLRCSLPPNTSNRRNLLPYSLKAIFEPQIGTKLTFTNSFQFGFIDCRTNPKERTTDLNLSDHFSMVCEKLYNHTHSYLNPNQTYVVSSHLLYVIDHRQFKEPLVRWAHQITEPAMMMTNELFFGTEVIGLTSRLPDDLKVFNYDGKSLSLMPFRPLSIKNSYNNLREKGHFLLSNEIKVRIAMSTTGIALKPEEGRLRIRLLTQNMAGDIYSSYLNCYDDKPDESDNLYKAFEEWDVITRENKTANDLMTIEERVERKELGFNDIARLKGLRKILLCENLQGNILEEENDNNMAVEKQPGWKISLMEAAKCKDVLAKEIMNVWEDVGFEDMRPSIFAETMGVNEPIRETSHDRVTKWLSAANDSNVVIEEISFLENSFDTTLEFTQPLAASSQLPKENIISTQEASQSVKKKKPRVAGF